MIQALILRKMPAWVFGLLLLFWLPMAGMGIVASLDEARALQAGRMLPPPPPIPATAFRGTAFGPAQEVAIAELVPVGAEPRHVQTLGPDTMYHLFLSSDARVAVAIYSVAQRAEAIDPSALPRAADGSVTVRGFLKPPTRRDTLYGAIQQELLAGGIVGADLWLVDPLLGSREEAFAHEIGGVWFRLGVVGLISVILLGLLWRALRRSRSKPRGRKGPWGAAPAPQTAPPTGRVRRRSRDRFHDGPIQSRKGWFW